MFEVTIHLNAKSNTPLYLQIYQYFKREIQSGRIEEETKLPSKRKLAEHLAVSQLTIESAYDQLKAEGYIHSQPRKGLFVQKVAYDILPAENAPTFPPMEALSKQMAYDFHPGKIDLDHFPHKTWRKISIECLSDEEHLLNGDPQGEFNLRKEISMYLFQSRGVRCSPDQIVIGAGTQYLVGILCMLMDKDSVVAIEDPGFHRTKHALKNHSMSIDPIPLDEEGIDVERLKNSSANIAYVTPSHQFPTGVVMPISRRLELLKWAEKTGGYIIEDDYDGEFRYKGKPIPSLQGIDASENVIYFGTFSKSLIPSARISYMILPGELKNNYQQTMLMNKQTVPRLYQNILFQFMKNGYWERHLNKMRTVYRSKHKTLMAAIHQELGERVTVIGDQSGLHILLKVHNNMSEEELIKAAEKHNVNVYPTSIYYEKRDNHSSPSLLLGFGGLSETEIKQGIIQFKKALF
ncbi:PLP-dependent aminotransferase family protein [Salicibibacter cibarius]|uniref:PLP-dependent aminotransferase family protein n=1 Tax=Salicibibacter cibarius TaxID=2743000 RepID=A0A7T7CD73_9BACI|nr:PLP-dependent aminotransferase family protein [Salicibibacter cibarius]QQK77688.1 PLP-dependent aminotransferase family protein [Salicibibacter cibarius]